MGKYAQANLIHATAHRPVDREFEILDRTKFGRGDKAKVDALGKGNFAWSNAENAWVRMKGIHEAEVDAKNAINTNQFNLDSARDASLHNQKLSQMGEQLKIDRDLISHREFERTYGEKKRYTERQKADFDHINEVLDNIEKQGTFTPEELKELRAQAMLKQIGIASSPRLSLDESPIDFKPRIYKDPESGRTFIQTKQDGEWTEDIPVPTPTPSVAETPSLTDQDKVKFVQEMIKNHMTIDDAIKAWDRIVPKTVGKVGVSAPSSALAAAIGGLGTPQGTPAPAPKGKPSSGSLSDYERKE